MASSRRAVTTAEHAEPDELLARATARFRDGDAFGAWADCERVAAIARVRGDAVLLARAGLVVRGVQEGAFVPRVHALCREALARLEADALAMDALAADGVVLRARVQAQLAATADRWSVATDAHPADAALQAAEASGDPDAILLALHAQRDRLGDPHHAAEWRVLGARAIELGDRVGDAAEVAWGRSCRMDAHWVLADRIALENELRLAEAESDPERQPVAAWRFALTRACLAMHDGRFELAARLADRALAEGRSRGIADAEYFDVVFRSWFTRVTGPDPVLDARTERFVRELVGSGLFLAHAWLALELHDQGRLDEAEREWRTVRGHLGEVPRHVPEYLVVLTGAVPLCVRFGDLELGAQVYAALLPYSGLYMIGAAHTPSGGPVALHLAALADLLGDACTAEEHAREALATAIAMASPVDEAFAELQLAAIARHSARRDQPSRDARRHAATARAIAERLGWAYLLRRLDAFESDDRAGLSRRELEIAALVADGRQNRQIAADLFLSERTVETHVRHILVKLGVDSRVGVAAWYAGRARDGAPHRPGR